jgi:endonuclease-3
MEKPGQSRTEKTKLRHNVPLSSIVITRNLLNYNLMKISERATLVDHELAKLYPNPPIPLDHEDSYTLLIAVLLSAQCTDARVNKITPNLFQLASNPLSMSQLSVDEINSIVRPCGLSPRKAQAIHGLSQILLDKHEGQVPRSFEELEELPGVGHKTASVVMAQSFGFPSFPVDTHIHRLAQRWKLTRGKSVVQTERDLKKLFPKERWNELHLQIIFYGREFCQARNCFGLECPICKALFPSRKSKVIAKKS